MSLTYRELIAFRPPAFQPPAGPGRCRSCGYHVETQGHPDGCPNDKRRPNG